MTSENLVGLAELADRVEALDGPSREVIERLDRTGQCWLWTGPLDHAGRGRLWRNGKIMLHHRAVWEILVGPIPEGALLCHHCDNPTCANPAHIYIGDGKTNARDMFSRERHWTQRDPERATRIGRENGQKNTWCRGAGNPKAKLTAEQVSEIKQAPGSSYAIAARFGVNASTIQRIKRGDAWNS